MPMTLATFYVISRGCTCFNLQHKHNLVVDPKQTVRSCSEDKLPRRPFWGPFEGPQISSQCGFLGQCRLHVWLLLLERDRPPKVHTKHGALPHECSADAHELAAAGCPPHLFNGQPVNSVNFLQFATNIEGKGSSGKMAKLYVKTQGVIWVSWLTLNTLRWTMMIFSTNIVWSKGLFTFSVQLCFGGMNWWTIPNTPCASFFMQAHGLRDEILSLGLTQADWPGIDGPGDLCTGRPAVKG